MREDLVDLVSIQKDGTHSKKPAAFVEIIESYSIAPFFEIFARDPEPRDNWWCHGYEARR
jgi:N6-adenosine-specific RNA methylase IME4